MPVWFELSCSSQAPSLTLRAAADAPTLAWLIAVATAARLRSPVETTATVASPTRSSEPTVRSIVPVPVETLTEPAVPADVTVVIALVPMRTAPSVPRS